MKLAGMALLGLVLCTGVICNPVANPSQIEIGFEGMGRGVDVAAISGDGRVVVGEVDRGMQFQAACWRDGVMEELAIPLGAISARATAVTTDGSVVVGDFRVLGGTEACRWWSIICVGLGELPGGLSQSFATGVSSDGSVVVGYSAIADDQTQAFRWTPELGLVALSGLKRATAVSADGSVVVGYDSTEQGDPVAIRWTADTGAVPLSYASERESHGYASAISADGSTVVGWRDTPLDFDSFSITLTEAFRWTEAEGMVGLGILPSFDDCFANAASADGTIIVGRCYASRPQPDQESYFSMPSEEAFIWDEEHGMRSLQKVLADDYGMDLSGWQLEEAVDISDDGRTIIGSGTNPDGASEAWIARLP